MFGYNDHCSDYSGILLVIIVVVIRVWSGTGCHHCCVSVGCGCSYHIDCYCGGHSDGYAAIVMEVAVMRFAFDNSRCGKKIEL